MKLSTNIDSIKLTSLLAENSMQRLLRCLVLFMSLSFVISADAVGQDIYAFSSAPQQQQFQNLLGQLRCLVCQNESLADSNAALANDLRNEVYAMVVAGKNDTQIKTYLINRYGDFIIFKPPLRYSTYLLWFAPLGILLLALLALLAVIKKRRMLVDRVLNQQEQQAVQKLLDIDKN